MPKKVLSMKEIEEILRLHSKGFTQQKIAQATRMSRSTVRDYITRARVADVTWPLSDEITSEQLKALLFSQKLGNPRTNAAAPNWGLVHQELKRKGVTLTLLWEEYKRTHTKGIQYSWFAHQYRAWAKTKEVWMLQSYTAGEKVFVDYSGLTMPIWRDDLREIAYHAEIFVGVLGGSDLIFCMATKTQRLPDWVDAHCRMFEYFGGVPEIVVPDNLRSGVTKPHRYEPTCNQTYLESMRHYGCVVMPTRVYRPKDKAKVEKAVQSVQRRILAVLRNEKFTSLEAYNAASFEKLSLLNNKPFQKLSYSRVELFDRVEKEALSPLPQSPYVFGEWFRFTINGGYHICIYNHNYSVPHTLVKKIVDVRVTVKIVECFHDIQRVALHARDDTPHTYTTLDAHRPEAHRQQAHCCQKHLMKQAEAIGINALTLITTLFLDPARHLHQKERSAQGILRLSNTYAASDFERACQTALTIGTCRYDSLQSILKQRLYNKEDASKTRKTTLHKNLRGSKYYR